MEKIKLKVKERRKKKIFRKHKNNNNKNDKMLIPWVQIQVLRTQLNKRGYEKGKNGFTKIKRKKNSHTYIFV